MQADAVSFDIDSTTGQLKTAADPPPLFDFEGESPKTSYMVMVTVTDGKDKARQPLTLEEVDDTIRVTITVTDVNEAPAFPSPTETGLRSVAENTPAGASIG